MSQTVDGYQKTSDKEKKAYAFFLSRGYNPQASAGIVGNLLYESNLDTSAEGDKGYEGGSSFGLAQFRGDRLKKLKQTYGEKWTDFDNQLAFVDWELNNTHKKAGEILRSTSDVHKAGQAFSDYYEIPAKKYAQNKGRRDKVSLAYARLSGDKTIPDYVSETKNVTTNFIDFNNSTKTPTFVESTESPVKEEEVENTVEVNEAKSILAEKQQERQSFIDYMEQIQAQPELTFEEPKQIQEAPQTDLLQTYAQIDQFIENPIAQEGGKIPVSKQGVYEHPKQNVIVPTKDGRITMQNVNYPILGQDEFGNQQMMYPNQEYKFQGKTILEIPQLKNYLNG